MAVSITNLGSPLAVKLVIDTTADATSAANVTGASGNLFLVEIDNTNNTAISYLKLYNHASPTVGTTAPDLVLPAPASTKLTYAIPQGVAFGTAISIAATTAGGTAGTGSPSGAVTVNILTS
tara:strand:- start:320 stop:685 length:366 start_codon:yes stop_codon:yes gene_type:complete